MNLIEKYNQESQLKNITETLESFSEQTLYNFTFNPHVRSINEIYDIMDKVQELQSAISNIKRRALKEELLINLCLKEANNEYNKLYDKYLLEIKQEEQLKNIKEKESFIRNKLFDEKIFELVNFFEKKELKIKNLLKRIDTFIDEIKEINDKVSRKITLMQLQKDLGTLVDLNLKNK